MQGTESVNVPDGKLLRVSVTYDAEIESVTLTGDFFLEPPEARPDLEAAIEGKPADATRTELEDAIEAVDAELIGFSASDLATATIEAIE